MIDIPRCQNGPYGAICYRKELEAEIARLRLATGLVLAHLRKRGHDADAGFCVLLQDALYPQPE